jgi:hypothetical protein
MIYTLSKLLNANKLAIAYATCLYRLCSMFGRFFHLLGKRKQIKPYTHVTP